MSDRIFRMSRFIGLDIAYLFTNGFWVVLRYGVVALAGVFTTVAFARLGSKELFGQYQFVLSLIALFSVFSLPGLNIAALKSVASSSSRIAVQQAVRWSLFSGLFAIPIIGCYVAYRYFFREDISLEMAAALAVGILALPFFYAPNTWYAAYEGVSIFKPVAIRMIVMTLVVTAALFLGLFINVGLIVLVAFYFGLTSAISWYFYFEVINNKKEKKSDVEINDSRLDIRYGLSVTVQKFVFGLSESLPPLILSHFLGLEFLAVFQVAYYFMNSVSGVLAALFAIYLPKLFNGMRLMHKRIMWQNIVAGFVSFLFLAVLLKMVFIFFYGESYLESYRLAWCLAPLLAFYPLRIYLVNFFTARGENRLIICIYIIANLLGPAVFIFIQNTNPIVASASYIYALTIVPIIGLLPIYSFSASRKTDSI